VTQQSTNFYATNFELLHHCNPLFNSRRVP
jgi:hypothetical protein